MEPNRALSPGHMECSLHDGFGLPRILSPMFHRCEPSSVQVSVAMLCKPGNTAYRHWHPNLRCAHCRNGCWID